MILSPKGDMMNKPSIQQLCKGFDVGVDKIRQLSKNFCQPLGITVFAYARVYPDHRISWLTSNPDQDYFLIDSGALSYMPLGGEKFEDWKEGHFLWFNDQQFPGCEAFFRERTERFHMDHGLVTVKHQKNYVEFCCFSGKLSKLPLYNLFMNEKALFCVFMEHFAQQLDRRSLNLLEHRVILTDFKWALDTPKKKDGCLEVRSTLVEACGWKNLLTLSAREKECLVLLQKGYSYSMIGKHLKLSERTVEHYIESVKNKLGLDTRAELCLASEKLTQLGL
jgi:DNA-binding CsgD family transcriptional regulator